MERMVLDGLKWLPTMERMEFDALYLQHRRCNLYITPVPITIVDQPGDKEWKVKQQPVYGLPKI
jgi:hypothetical protein